MKKVILSAILIVSVLSIGGYFLYRFYITDFIAEAIVSESLPGYIPKRIQNKIEEIRAPLNKGTEGMLKNMRASHISMDQVLEVVDKTTEEQAYALLNELNKIKPKNTNEVFDVAKKHFTTDFDVEVFRKTFNDHIEMKQVRKAIFYANLNRRSKDVDITTAKVIVKKILLQKEKEYDVLY